MSGEFKMHFNVYMYTADLNPSPATQVCVHQIVLCVCNILLIFILVLNITRGKISKVK